MKEGEESRLLAVLWPHVTTCGTKPWDQVHPAASELRRAPGRSWCMEGALFHLACSGQWGAGPSALELRTERSQSCRNCCDMLGRAYSCFQRPSGSDVPFMALHVSKNLSLRGHTNMSFRISEESCVFRHLARSSRAQRSVLTLLGMPGVCDGSACFPLTIGPIPSALILQPQIHHLRSLRFYSCPSGRA